MNVNNKVVSDNELEKHDSYAMISFARTSSNQGTNLFGSSILHSNTIRMRVKRGEVNRYLNSDWFHGGEELIEVEMSMAQFAEAITSLNMGEGVPVTLLSFNQQRSESCPHINKRLQIEQEFEKSVKELSARLEELTRATKNILNEKKPLSKANRDTILREIDALKMAVNSNIPFVQRSFNRQMDKTVSEAKGEVDGFVMNKIISTGIEGLESSQLMIEEEK